MADDLLARGKRSILCGEIAQAVDCFQKACELLASEYGDLDDKLAEPNFLYGSALLELARMESTVIGNALTGVPDDDDSPEADDLVETGPELTNEEKEELSNQVIDALCEQNVDVGPKDADNNGASAVDETGETNDEEEESDSQEDEGDIPNDAGDAKGEKEDGDEVDTQDDISNLQLAWEVLEVSKNIYSRKDDVNSKLKVADCLEKLAEISREKEDYTQSLSDLQECLDLRISILNDGHRDIAETYYQIGTTHAIAGSLDLASTSFQNAITCLQRHLNTIRTNISELEKHDGKTAELERLHNSLKEVESLIPDIQRRCAEVEEDRTTTELDVSNSSPSIAKAAESDTSAKVADDISHLVRKKRPVVENDVTKSELEPCALSNGTPELKKAKLSTEDTTVDGKSAKCEVSHTNGSQDNPITEQV